MGDRWAALRALPKPGDALTAWVDTDPEAIHFLDAVFATGPGLANVRREYRDEGGVRLFKLYLAPGAVDEALAVLRRASGYVRIGEVRVER